MIGIRRWIQGAGVWLACVIFAGCNQQPVWEIVYPVEGTVTLRGQAVADADLVLFPEGQEWPETVRPRGRTGPDGRFVVWTYEPGDGAPAGRYKVTLVRNAVGLSKGAVVAKPNDLPSKYERLESTDLQVTISEGENCLPAISL